jgi:hypothetical protein
MDNEYDKLDLAIMGVERVLAEFREAQENGYALGAEHLATHMSFFLDGAHKHLMDLRLERTTQNADSNGQ